MLVIQQLSKSYQTPQGPVPVLQDINLNLASGETLALTGDSGSGKSTLLHLIAGLDRADRGLIQVGDQAVTGLNEPETARLRRFTVGLIFQQFNLIPSLSVGANLAFQARLAERHDPDYQQSLAQRLGLADLLQRYPEQLSGGQQQRVAIGRTLAARPALVLADEPTGNLDQGAGDIILDLLLELVADTGCSLLLVTHSQRLAARLSSQTHLVAGRLR